MASFLDSIFGGVKFDDPVRRKEFMDYLPGQVDAYGNIIGDLGGVYGQQAPGFTPGEAASAEALTGAGDFYAGMGLAPGSQGALDAYSDYWQGGAEDVVQAQLRRTLPSLQSRFISSGRTDSPAHSAAIAREVGDARLLSDARYMGLAPTMQGLAERPGANLGTAAGYYGAAGDLERNEPYLQVDPYLQRMGMTPNLNTEAMAEQDWYYNPIGSLLGMGLAGASIYDMLRRQPGQQQPGQPSPNPGTGSTGGAGVGLPGGLTQGGETGGGGGWDWPIPGIGFPDIFGGDRTPGTIPGSNDGGQLPGNYPLGGDLTESLPDGLWGYGTDGGGGSAPSGGGAPVQRPPQSSGGFDYWSDPSSAYRLGQTLSGGGLSDIGGLAAGLNPAGFLAGGYAAMQLANQLFGSGNYAGISPDGMTPGGQYQVDLNRPTPFVPGAAIGRPTPQRGPDQDVINPITGFPIAGSGSGALYDPWTGLAYTPTEVAAPPGQSGTTDVYVPAYQAPVVSHPEFQGGRWDQGVWSPNTSYGDLEGRGN